MDRTYLVRRSQTSGAVPTAATGTTGELIANTYDGRLWLRGNTGTNTIFEITRPLVSTFAQSGATTGQTIVWNGSAWNPAYITIAAGAIEQGEATNRQAILWNDIEGLWLPTTVEPDFLGSAGATTGQCIAWNGTQWAPAARLTQTVNVQTFDSSGTWTKPAGAVTTTIQLCGGGAGGGVGNSGTGGDGGAAGEPFLISVASSTLSATESVTIGAGGIAATVGNTTTFNKFFAMRGGATGFGTVRNANKQDVPFTGNAYHGAGVNLGGNGYRNPLGAGGGGAGSNAVNASGGTGGGSSAERPIVYGSSALATQGGGAAGGAAGNPGAVGSDGVTDANGFGSGAGGGGAAATGFPNALGGNGGNGIRGSGGGGGGRGGSTSIGGSTGGSGGNGFAIITTVCYA